MTCTSLQRQVCPHFCTCVPVFGCLWDVSTLSRHVPVHVGMLRFLPPPCFIQACPICHRKVGKWRAVLAFFLTLSKRHEKVDSSVGTTGPTVLGKTWKTQFESFCFNLHVVKWSVVQQQMTSLLSRIYCLKRAVNFQSQHSSLVKVMRSTVIEVSSHTWSEVWLADHTTRGFASRGVICQSHFTSRVWTFTQPTNVQVGVNFLLAWSKWTLQSSRHIQKKRTLSFGSKVEVGGRKDLTGPNF